jgi:phytoene/squalene synthetase
MSSNTYTGYDPVFIALADTIEKHQLPVSLLADLLDAFEQDITQKEYKQWQDVLSYCQRSANPIGRLLLHLNQTASTNLLQQSDAICTALQLINFFQDIKQDYTENNRIYLPLEDTDGISISQSISSDNSLSIAPKIRTHYLATLELITEGYMLGTQLSGRLGWEIRSITLSGLFLLKQLSLQTDEELFSRPRLSRQQMFAIVSLSMAKPTFNSYCHRLFKQITLINNKLP